MCWLRQGFYLRHFLRLIEIDDDRGTNFYVYIPLICHKPVAVMPFSPNRIDVWLGCIEHRGFKLPNRTSWAHRLSFDPELAIRIWQTYFDSCGAINWETGNILRKRFRSRVVPIAIVAVVWISIVWIGIRCIRPVIGAIRPCRQVVPG